MSFWITSSSLAADIVGLDDMQRCSGKSNLWLSGNEVRSEEARFWSGISINSDCHSYLPQSIVVAGQNIVSAVDHSYSDSHLVYWIKQNVNMGACTLARPLQDWWANLEDYGCSLVKVQGVPIF